VHYYVMKLNTLINENNVERLIPILQESFRNLRLEQNYRTYTTVLTIGRDYRDVKKTYRYSLNYWGSLLLEKYPQKLEKYKSFIGKKRVRINKEVSDIKIVLPSFYIDFSERILSADKNK
jgi:hypothetical protein